jgi:hypothetical protein
MVSQPYPGGITGTAPHGITGTLTVGQIELAAGPAAHLAGPGRVIRPLHQAINQGE